MGTYRRSAKGRHSRKAFKRRAGKMHRLNAATPLRGGIRL